MMKTSGKEIVAVLALVFSMASLADTLELANGAIHEGKFIGSSNGITPDVRDQHQHTAWNIT